MTKHAILLVSIALLWGCAVNPRDIGREPHLTPVGSGLRPDRVPMVSQPAPTPVYYSGNSFWQDSSADLFRDPRAMKLGDVVTVKIAIKDKASLDSTSNRSRDSKNSLDFGQQYDLNTNLLKGKGEGSIASSIDAKTSSKGEGGTTRSESIELLVAAVVTDVMPNGNLVISGTQEVRVNFEVRVLSVAGVVRPRDISTDNSVSYEKIAEARISYGGRGRITEVQQPGLGQQILDIIAPF
jgi:flagellar L-ring protein precursor FlgH